MKPHDDYTFLMFTKCILFEAQYVPLRITIN